MIKKYGLLILVIAIMASCVKETYEVDKISKSVQLTPSVVFSAFSGNVTIGNVVQDNDTIVVDENKFMSLVIRKDSAVTKFLDDFYDFGNMVSFSDFYEFGNLTLSPFTGTMNFTLGQVSQNFPDGGTAIAALDDGAVHQFPSFQSTTLPERTFTGISNFQSATFASGTLEISLTNNLTTTLSGFSIRLYNVSGHTLIAGPLGFNNPILPGSSAILSIDLAGKTLTNQISAAVILAGSPGNTTPVIISRNNSNIQFSAQGKNLKVSSGLVILPSQTVSLPQTSDILDFNPGTGIEIEKMKILTGNLTCNVRSSSSLYASLTLTLPSSRRNGFPVTETMNMIPYDQYTRNISFSNTEVDLNSDPLQPYNRLPFTYTLSVTSNNGMVNFNSTDKVTVNLSLLNPGFDFIKGYFGQQVETIEGETIDFGIDDVLSKISGDMLFPNPSVKVIYSNSFAIPIDVMIEGTGVNGSETANLGLTQNITVAKPDAPAVRDIVSSFTIDKTNSSLPALVSLPPGEITFSGSAKMNPAGDPSHLRNNYVFGNSRFLISYEFNLPLQFRSNLVLTHTMENFLKSDGENSLDGGDFKDMKLDITARNKFPFNVSLKLKLLDAGNVVNTVDAPELLGAAPVDAAGKSTGETETKTSIPITQAFLDSAVSADSLAVEFRLITPANGSKEIKIYSDYSIDFNVRLSATLEKTFDLK